MSDETTAAEPMTAAPEPAAEPQIDFKRYADAVARFSEGAERENVLANLGAKAYSREEDIQADIRSLERREQAQNG